MESLTPPTDQYAGSIADFIAYNLLYSQSRLAEVDTSIRGPGEHEDQFPSEEVMPSHRT